MDKVFDQFGQADAEAKRQEKLVEDAAIEEEFQRLKKLGLSKPSLDAIAVDGDAGLTERGHADEGKKESTKEAVRDIFSTFKNPGSGVKEGKKGKAKGVTALTVCRWTFLLCLLSLKTSVKAKKKLNHHRIKVVMKKPKVRKQMC